MKRLEQEDKSESGSVERVVDVKHSRYLKARRFRFNTNKTDPKWDVDPSMTITDTVIVDQSSVQFHYVDRPANGRADRLKV